MEKYKPSYMGKVMPADDPAKLTDFVANKFDAFSKAYDACKDQSENIKDVSATSTPNDSSNSFAMKVSTDSETLKKIDEATKSDDSVSVKGDVITANA